LAQRRRRRGTSTRALQADQPACTERQLEEIGQHVAQDAGRQKLDAAHDVTVVAKEKTKANRVAVEPDESCVGEEFALQRVVGDRQFNPASTLRLWSRLGASEPFLTPGRPFLAADCAALVNRCCMFEKRRSHP
jgi:hypothetical protein